VGLFATSGYGGRFLFSFVAVFLSLVGQSLLAGQCPTWLGQLTETTAIREAQKANRDTIEQLMSVEEGLTQATAELSATQYQLRKTSDLIDNYLLLGDIGALVTLYDGPVRRVERALLERKRCEASVESLKAGLSTLPEDELSTSDLESLRAGLAQRLENSGQFDPGTATTLVSGSVSELRTLLQTKISALQNEIDAYEKSIGRDFDIYREVRKHLSALITADDKYLLDRVQQVDNRGLPGADKFGLQSMAPRSMVQLSGNESSVDPRVARMELIDARIKKLDTELSQLDGWTTALTNGKLSVSDLRQALSANQPNYLLLFGSLREATAVDNPDANQLTALKAELATLRERLNDAHHMIDGAQKLDDALGVQKGEFVLSSSLLPEKSSLRPEVSEVEQIQYQSPKAQISRGWVHLRRQVWSFLDSTILLGFATGAVPMIGGAADVVSGFKNTKARDFVYGKLFRSLYDEHVSRQYFPKLILLKRVHGEDAKLALMLENLNAGTKDELLLTLARRTDMKSQWLRIRAYAKSVKDSDHHHLFDRMAAMEQRVNGIDGKAGLGTISVIDQSSSTRYLLAALVQGTLAALTSQHQFRKFCTAHGWTVPAGSDVAIPESKASDAKKLAWLESKIRPEEEKASLDDLKLVLQASHTDHWSSQLSAQVEAATDRLSTGEIEYSGRLCNAASAI